jgi:hypothetical protein
MDEAKAYNLRQIKLIESRIHEFKNKKISLDRLIFDLEALLNYIQNSNKEWFDEFQGLIGELDIIDATIAYENRKACTKEELTQLDNYLKEISILVNQYKKENFTKEELE